MWRHFPEEKLNLLYIHCNWCRPLRADATHTHTKRAFNSARNNWHILNFVHWLLLISSFESNLAFLSTINSFGVIAGEKCQQTKAVRGLFADSSPTVILQKTDLVLHNKKKVSTSVTLKIKYLHCRLFFLRFWYIQSCPNRHNWSTLW